MNKVFVGGLNRSTRDFEFNTYFEKFGNIVDSIIMTNRATGVSRGFGFVTFDNIESVNKVMENQYHVIDNQRCQVKRAVPQNQLAPGAQTGPDGQVAGEVTSDVKVFCGGLPHSTDNNQFRSWAERFGEVEDSIVMVFADSGRSRGFGYITFKEAEVCKRFLAADAEIDGRRITTKAAVTRTYPPLSRLLLPLHSFVPFSLFFCQP